jgi:hypothetical protein
MSPRTETEKSTLCSAPQADGTKRMNAGRSSPSPSRTSSPPSSGATPSRTIKDSWPDAWEAIFGTILAAGESRTKDQRAFEAEHAADWIVVSAITSDQQKGFVECVATPGGKRGPGTEERRFLVPSGEYEIGRFGFVIYPDRHPVYAGPSSFIGWRGRGSP